MSVTQLRAPVDVPSVGFFKQECFSIDVFLFCSNSVYVWLILCTRPPHLLPQKPAVLFALSLSLFLWSFLLILGHAALATKTWQLPQHLRPPQPPPFLVCMRCQPLVRLISQLWDNWKQCLFSWLKITAIWVYLGLFVPLFILLDILQLDNASLHHSFQGAVKPALPSCLDGNSHLLIPEELLVASARNCSFGILTWVGTSSLFQTQRRAVSTLWEKSSRRLLMPFGWLPILGPTDNSHLSCLSPFCFQMCPDDLWPPPQIFQSWVCWVPPHWSRLWHSPHSVHNIIGIIAVFNSGSYCFFFFFFPAHRNQCEIKTITNGKSYHFPDIEENPKNKHQGSIWKAHWRPRCPWALPSVCGKGGFASVREMYKTCELQTETGLWFYLGAWKELTTEWLSQDSMKRSSFLVSIQCFSDWDVYAGQPGGGD